MGPAETVETQATTASCSGDGGPLGHPRVFLNLLPHGRVECPYCSRLFVNPTLSGAAEDATIVPPGSDTTIAPPRRAAPA